MTIVITETIVAGEHDSDIDDDINVSILSVSLLLFEVSIIIDIAGHLIFIIILPSLVTLLVILIITLISNRSN